MAPGSRDSRSTILGLGRGYERFRGFWGPGSRHLGRLRGQGLFFGGLGLKD